MRRRDVLSVLPAVCLAGSLKSAAAAAEEKPALSVGIALPARQGKSRILEYRGPDKSHFHVVLRNDSGAPARIWREWCSWGYYNLSLGLVLPDGKEVEVKKGVQAWTKNYPDWEELGAGEVAVREVAYGGPDWENFPLDLGKGPVELTMSAKFAVEREEEAAKSGVWAGSVKSPAVKVTLYNYT